MGMRMMVVWSYHPPSVSVAVPMPMPMPMPVPVPVAVPLACCLSVCSLVADWLAVASFLCLGFVGRGGALLPIPPPHMLRTATARLADLLSSIHACAHLCPAHASIIRDTLL